MTRHAHQSLARLTCGCALAALLVPCLARAHEPSREATDAGPAQGPQQYVEEIDVSGHYESGIGTSEAASSGKITRQLVEDRPILRPGEVLELVPGLVITQHSGAGKANQYFLRGFNLDHGTDFLTTLDGVPLNLRSHAHGQGYTDLNFLIPELIQRVEYFKGPYFADKGDFASAGAADIHYADSLPKTLAEIAGGNFGYARGLFAGSLSAAGSHFLYGLELFHEDGPWEHPDNYRRINGVLRYSLKEGDAKWTLTAMGYYGIWNATDQIPRRAVESGQIGQIGRFGAIDPTDGGNTYRFSVAGDYQQSYGSLLLQANLYAVKYNLDLFSNFTYFLHDPIHGDQFEQSDDRWQLGTSGSFIWTAPLEAVHLHATFGWEARSDSIDPVGLYPTEAQQRLGTVRQDEVRETSGAVYGEVDARVAPWLRLIGGARVDVYAFDVTSSNPKNSGHDDAARVSPKLSAIFGPWARTELFANFGFGFHSNDARGVTTTVDPKTGDPVSKVPPLVGTRGAEIGARTEILPRLQSSVALWRLDLDSEILFLGDAGTTEASRSSRRYGVEWSTQWHPLHWLLFDSDLSWSHARFTSPDPDPNVTGSYIPGSIEWAASAGVTLHELGPFRASLFMRYFGPRPLVEDDSQRSTASTLFNGQVSCQITRWAKLTLDVFNILNAQVDDIAYYYASHYPQPPPGQPPVGVKDIHFHPAESRSFRLAAAFTF
ncbi:MAG TPA: TonB-dependent receptor plug domain-containing protein [Myxococcales bacterium]|nr:TonB-dependent receptor plug domain-containing protein [Myxococcales bacterium]